MVKILIILFLIMPSCVFGADHSVTLMVKGEAYKSCTITMPNKFEMGRFRSKYWTDDGYMWQHNAEFNINLTDCDKDTVITVKARGDHLETETTTLKNRNVRYPDIMANFHIFNEETDAWTMLHLNEQHPRNVVRLTGTDTTKILKLRGQPRRKPNSTELNPVGVFEGELTLIFEFS